MRHKSASLTVEEMHQVKHLMGGALTLVAFWSLLSLDLGSGVLVLLSMLGVALSMAKPDLLTRIPPLVWRLATPALILWVGSDFLLSAPELIPPLVRMIILLLLYRNFAPRRQREDLQLILLCLFCLIMAGVMTVSLLFAFQILFFTPLAMALLFIICLLDRGEPTKAEEVSWVGFGWRRISRRVLRVLDWKVLALGSALFGLVVLVSTLLFILTPRFDIEEAIPFLQFQAQPLTGFSEKVDLDAVSSLQRDNSVAIRIDLPSVEALPAEPYWRMLVLDAYSNGSFILSDDLGGIAFKQHLNLREFSPDGFRSVDSAGEEWTFYMEGGVSRYLPVPGDFGLLRFRSTQMLDVLRIPRVYRVDRVSQTVFSFQTENLRFNDRFPVSERERKLLSEVESGGFAEPTKYPGTTAHLPLSKDDLDQLSRINEQIHSGEPLSVSEYSRKVRGWLWENFKYSLDANGRSGGASDPVVNWLSEGDRGHCELFASALVLLAREAGYPARLVVGFAGGSWNSVEDYFVLRNSDAHAWVELYDRDAREWLRIDPTPGYGLTDADGQVARSMQYDTGWGAWLDSLRILWYRRIVSFEQEDQLQLARSAKEAVKAFVDEIGAQMKAFFAAAKAWLAQPFRAADWFSSLWLVVLAVMFLLLWRVRDRIVDLLYIALNRSETLDPVRKRASRYLRKISEKHGPVGPDPIRLELQRLRFGPTVKRDEALPILNRAKEALRRKKS